MDIKFIGENWQIVISFGVALVSLLLGIRANAKRSLLPETKEEQLSKQVEDLRKTVSTLITELDLARKRIQELETQLVSARDRINILETSQSTDNTKRATILVGIGPNINADIEIAAMRGIRDRASLSPMFMQPIQYKRMRSLLDTRRAADNPVRYAHLIVSLEEGKLVFKDAHVAPVDLSASLTDVDVLVLTGDNTSEIAEYLSSVPYVVTAHGSVPAEATALFSRIFWTSIGNGNEPGVAFYEAIERSPILVMDSFELHT